MRAARIVELGAPPAIDEIDPPAAGTGEVTIELEAASLNPADLAIASGGFYAGHPPVPYVPGLEGVGRVAGEGRRVMALGGGLGVTRDGTAAEQFAAPVSALIDLREDIDAGVAAALGTAALAGWLPITWAARVQPGETVLVLGATGTAGWVAVQASRLARAERVVAAGRNPARLRMLEELADEVVSLAVDDPAARLQGALPDGADVVFDPLWAEPLLAALTAARVGGRVVHLGQSAGTTANLSSALVRGRRLTIIGYSNFGVPRADTVTAYLQMVDLAVAGRLKLPVDSVALEDIGRAWAGVAASAGKFVVTP